MTCIRTVKIQRGGTLDYVIDYNAPATDGGPYLQPGETVLSNPGPEVTVTAGPIVVVGQAAVQDGGTEVLLWLQCPADAAQGTQAEVLVVVGTSVAQRRVPVRVPIVIE